MRLSHLSLLTFWWFHCCFTFHLKYWLYASLIVPGPWNFTPWQFSLHRTFLCWKRVYFNWFKLFEKHVNEKCKQYRNQKNESKRWSKCLGSDFHLQQNYGCLKVTALSAMILKVFRVWKSLPRRNTLIVTLSATKIHETVLGIPFLQNRVWTFAPTIAQHRTIMF